MFELVDGELSIWLRHVKASDQVANFLNKCHTAAQQCARVCKLAQVGSLGIASKNIAMANKSARDVIAALSAQLFSQGGESCVTRTDT